MLPYQMLLVLSSCLVCPNGETADSSLGYSGVRNNLQGLQAEMA